MDPVKKKKTLNKEPFRALGLNLSHINSII